MQTNFSLKDLNDPELQHADDILRKCVHCGFCLPTCPTYDTLGQETDTPRGRIILMKETFEGTLSLDESLPYIDRCLGCLACETSCPSGVEYRNLLGPFREKASRETTPPTKARFFRWLALGVLTHPSLFRFLSKFAFLAKVFRGILPKQMCLMLELLPKKIPRAVGLSEIYSPSGKPRARVALVAGCAQGVLEPEINISTISVLVRNGVEVLIPRNQGCCGALHWHSGDGERTRRFALQNLRAFSKGFDAVISNAAGCGSCLQEYPIILKGTKKEKVAIRFSNQVHDLSCYLEKIDFQAPPPTQKPLRIVYQDACHLRHAQGVFDAPRKILQAIKGVDLVEIEDADMCCGSAGIYNIEQPDIGDELGRRKAAKILEAKPDIVVSANIGCITQLRHHLKPSPSCPKVLHLAVALNLAYSGTLDS